MHFTECSPFRLIQPRSIDDPVGLGSSRALINPELVLDLLKLGLAEASNVFRGDRKNA